jgi:hypothetical protein
VVVSSAMVDAAARGVAMRGKAERVREAGMGLQLLPIRTGRGGGGSHGGVSFAACLPRPGYTAPFEAFHRTCCVLRCSESGTQVWAISGPNLDMGQKAKSKPTQGSTNVIKAPSVDTRYAHEGI